MFSYKKPWGVLHTGSQGYGPSKDNGVHVPLGYTVRAGGGRWCHGARGRRLVVNYRQNYRQSYFRGSE